MGNIFSCDVNHKKQYDEIIQNINIIKQTLYRFDILHDLKKKKIGVFIMILNDSHHDLSKRQKALEKIILEINNIYDGFDLENLRKNIIYVSEQIGLFMSTVDTVKQQKHLLVLKKAEITLSNQITQLIERYVDANKNNLQPLFDQIRDTILDEKSTVFNNIREKFNEMKKREMSHNVNDITKNVDYLSKYFPETVSNQDQFSYDDENYYDKKREQMYRNRKNEYNTYKTRYEYPYRDTDYFDNYKRGQSIYRKHPYSDYASKYTDPMYGRYEMVSERKPYSNTSLPNYVPDFQSIQKSKNKNVMMRKAPTRLDDLETSFQSTSLQSSIDSDDTQFLKNKSMYQTPMKNVHKKYSPAKDTKISPLDKSILYTKRDVTPPQYKSSTPISLYDFENRNPYNTPGSRKSVRFSPSPGIGTNRTLSSQKRSSTSRDDDIISRNREKNLLSTGRTKKVDILSPIIDNSQDQVSQLSVGSLKPRQDQKRTLFGKLYPKLGDDDDSVGYVSGSKRKRRKSDSTKLVPFKYTSPSDEMTGIYEQQKEKQQQDEQEQDEQEDDEQEQDEQEQDEEENESLSDEARKILSSSKKGRELRKTLSLLDDYRESF